MAEAAGLVHCKFEDLLCFGCELDAVRVEVRNGSGDALHDLTDAIGSHAQFAQDPASHTAFFIHQPQKKMLGSNVVLAGALSFLMCQAENTPCSLCKSLHASHSDFFS